MRDLSSIELEMVNGGHETKKSKEKKKAEKTISAIEGTVIGAIAGALVRSAGAASIVATAGALLLNGTRNAAIDTNSKMAAEAKRTGDFAPIWY